MESKAKKIRGTKEWAVANIDCCTGCSHGCRYCYARYDAVVKRKQVSNEAWEHCQVREEDVTKNYPCYPGQVMFPCTHDIVPENLDACIQVIENLLKADNKILIVSKPHLDCVKRLCKHFQYAKDSLLFRFTITSLNNDILSFWEPGAPDFQERYASLKHAFANGFTTSISVEPMLDAAHVVELVEKTQSFVSHSIWLGKMNKIEKRVEVGSEKMKEELSRIRAEQSDENIKELYALLQNNPIVFWKESIKEVLNLELAKEPGLDR